MTAKIILVLIFCFSMNAYSFEAEMVETTEIESSVIKKAMALIENLDCPSSQKTQILTYNIYNNSRAKRVKILEDLFNENMNKVFNKDSILEYNDHYPKNAVMNNVFINGIQSGVSKKCLTEVYYAARRIDLLTSTNTKLEVFLGPDYMGFFLYKRNKSGLLVIAELGL